MKKKQEKDKARIQDDGYLSSQGGNHRGRGKFLHWIGDSEMLTTFLKTIEKENKIGSY